MNKDFLQCVPSPDVFFSSLHDCMIWSQAKNELAVQKFEKIEKKRQLYTYASQVPWN